MVLGKTNLDERREGKADQPVRCWHHTLRQWTVSEVSVMTYYSFILTIFFCLMTTLLKCEIV
jgi:hypothetical protein